jgi:hypothetical protein
MKNEVKQTKKPLTLTTETIKNLGVSTNLRAGVHSRAGVVICTSGNGTAQQ